MAESNPASELKSGAATQRLLRRGGTRAGVGISSRRWGSRARWRRWWMGPIRWWSQPSRRLRAMGRPRGRSRRTLPTTRRRVGAVWRWRRWRSPRGRSRARGRSWGVLGRAPPLDSAATGCSRAPPTRSRADQTSPHQGQGAGGVHWQGSPETAAVLEQLHDLLCIGPSCVRTSFAVCQLRRLIPIRTRGNLVPEPNR